MSGRTPERSVASKAQATKETPMTHHRNIISKFAATTAVFAALGAVSGPAWSSAGGPGASHVRWTKQQLDQLASAYTQKNPGWTPPAAAAAATPAQKTWTPAALDRLTAAYVALNPGWTRP
jgi:hypothetical protein